MTGWKFPWITCLAGLLLAVGMPLVAHLLHRNDERGCERDGMPIVPIYRVEVVDGEARDHVFCCIYCAEKWLERRPTPPRAVTVIDETSGQRIAAQAAVYARSSVVTTLTTGNRIHAFRALGDAEKHVAQFGGTVLPEEERPFEKAFDIKEP